MKLFMRGVNAVQRNHLLATQALAHPLCAGIRQSVAGDGFHRRVAQVLCDDKCDLAIKRSNFLHQLGRTKAQACQVPI